jgi:16S rRNA (cytidine1402-2'-O)-methyltransferase
VGTLYIVGAPAGVPGDLTRRALRSLREVALIVAAEGGIGAARRLLSHHGISTPLQAVTSAELLLEALATNDVALLTDGISPGPSPVSQRLIGAVLQRGFAVVPIPGPTLAITALVISGLPSDSFVYVGRLPRGELPPGGLPVDERRTLIALAEPDHLPGILAGLYGLLGDRPLVVVADSDRGTEVVWRGTLERAAASQEAWLGGGAVALVIGGAQAEARRWDEERLQAEIAKLLDQGLGAKEISQLLAVVSGWRRRRIYDLVVEIARVQR